MKIPSGSVDRYIYFVAVDATDLKTRETALAGFVVYRSRNGGAATLWTTPTVIELSAANMPGVYALLVDEDTTVDAGRDTEAMLLHVTHASMAPVSYQVELYRPETTEGQTLTVSAGAIGALAANTVTAAALAADATTEIQAGLATAASITSLDGRIPAALVGGRMDASVGALAANTITSTALAASATAEIADAVLDEVVGDHLTAYTLGAMLYGLGNALFTDESDPGKLYVSTATLDATGTKFYIPPGLGWPVPAESARYAGRLAILARPGGQKDIVRITGVATDGTGDHYTLTDVHGAAVDAIASGTQIFVHLGHDAAPTEVATEVVPLAAAAVAAATTTAGRRLF